MAKIRSQKWQLRAQISVLLTPQQKPEYGKRMPQIMQANVPVAARPRNAGGLQCLVESIAQGGNRIPSPARAGKERHIGTARSEALGCQHPAVCQTLS